MVDLRPPLTSILLLGLLMGFSPIAAQDTPGEEPKSRIVGGVEPQAPVTSDPEYSALRGAEVPYEVRAKSLLWTLGSMQAEDRELGTDNTEKALRAYDLDPRSEAARELLAVAAEFHQEYRQSLVSRFALPKAVQDRMETEAYRAAGAAFGSWLAAREADHWAIGPLLDRLLNNPASSLVLVSDEGKEEFEAAVGAFCQAFRDQVQDELGWLPRRFQP